MFFFYENQNYSQVRAFWLGFRPFSVQIPSFCTAQGPWAPTSKHGMQEAGQDASTGGLYHIPVLPCVERGRKAGRNSIQTSWNSHSQTNTLTCSEWLLWCEEQIDSSNFKGIIKIMAAWVFLLHKRCLSWAFWQLSRTIRQAQSFRSPSYIHPISSPRVDI